MWSAPYIRGEEAIELSEREKPDLILLDVMMKGLSGIETCRLIKANDAIAHIPVIFITALQDEQEQAQCWDAGCVDFVSKPVNGGELRNRVRAHLTHKLQTDLLLTLTYVDKLTGVYNRHYLDDVLPKLEKQALRQQTSLAILMIDIDWFKLYNDHFGHLQGDECLCKIAEDILSVLLRPQDIMVRFGGEEFICLLPETKAEGALHVADNIIQQVKGSHITHPKSPLERVSVSIGIAIYHADISARSIFDVINLADQQLYQAKSLGRNQASLLTSG